MTIDTHAHLTDSAFAPDLPNVLRRATESGVNRVVVVSQCVSDARSVLELCARYADLLCAAVGLHPEQVNQMSDTEALSQCAQIESMIIAHDRAIVAIGEIGLDFSPHVLANAPDDALASQSRQRTVFDRLLRAAVRASLPVSVHSRAAGRHALDAIAQVPNVTAVMHAFDGRAVYAERALAVERPGSLFFSVPPIIARSEQMRKLVRRLPMQFLLLESDAPALAEVAGSRNEPASVCTALQWISTEKNVEMDKVRSLLLENTLRCFGRL